MLKISRSSALKGGLKRYFTGKPCVNGHMAERNARNRACCQCNVEKLRAYYAADIAATREKWRLHSAKRRKDKPEKTREGTKLAQRRHRAKKTQSERRKTWRDTYHKASKASIARRLARLREQRKRNPLKFRAYAQRRRARIYAAPGSIKAADVERLFVKQRGLCAYNFCKKDISGAYHIDHIVPLALGGANDRKNIQLLCPKCNTRKGAKHPVDFAQENGLLL